MLVIILGSDYSLARRSLASTLATRDPTGMNTTQIDGADAASDEILEAVSTMPLFGGERVVVVTNWMSKWQTSKSDKRSGKEKVLPDHQDFMRILRSIPDSTVMVVFEPDLGELPTAARNATPADATILTNNAPRGEKLVRFAQQVAQENGAELDRPTTQAILDSLFPVAWRQVPTNRTFDRPPSIELLTNEIQKLAAYAYPEPIGRDHVNRLTPRAIEERMFPLLDAVVSGATARAALEYSAVIMAGEDTARISNQIYQQVELAAASVASGRPADPVEAGRRIGLTNPNRMRAIELSAARWLSGARSRVRSAVRVDRQLKSGRLARPEDAISNLICSLEQRESSDRPVAR